MDAHITIFFAVVKFPLPPSTHGEPASCHFWTLNNSHFAYQSFLFSQTVSNFVDDHHELAIEQRIQSSFCQQVDLVQHAPSSMFRERCFFLQFRYNASNSSRHHIVPSEAIPINFDIHAGQLAFRTVTVKSKILAAVCFSNMGIAAKCRL